MLEAERITVKYGERVAVDAITLNLERGQITTIIGPNGAGKSTLLKALNGQIRVSAGSIRIDDTRLESLNRRSISKRIAVVAQEADLRFPITVLEFVLGGRFAWATNVGWGWESDHDIEVAEKVLAETELSDLSGRFMNELSGGERQRAVLARALTTEATYLLLDEPTANLDLSHQSTLLKLVRARADQQNTAALVITHDLNLASQFSDYVLLMKNGKAITFGRPTDVLTPDLLQQVFDLTVLVDAHPVTGVPRVTPVHHMYRDS